MMKLTVAGMGPGPVGQFTLGALEAARRADALVLQTIKHPVAEYLKEQGLAFETLDALYEGAEDFDALNADAAALLRDRLSQSGNTVLLLYGEGLWAHALCAPVLQMAADAGAEIELLPGVSGADAAVGAAIMSGAPEAGAEGMQTVFAAGADAIRPDAGRTLIVREIDGALAAGAVKLWLLEYYPAGHRVYLVREQGGGARAEAIALHQLDRQATDHTASLLVPPIALEDRERFGFDALVAIMDRLRGEGGCPWDREQTHQSLKQYLIEEAYEVLEALDDGDDEQFADELGDVLLQVVFHARIAREQGRFNDRDVTTAVCRKMLRRHTHIFGDAKADTAADVLVNWEEIKRGEKGVKAQSEVLSGVPRNLPALLRGEKVQQKAAQVGFDWEKPEQALQKVFEEARELEAELSGGGRVGEELGDLLFAVVNTARLAGVNSELALTAATDKFIGRFADMEALARKEGLRLDEMGLEALDALWERIKSGAPGENKV